MWRLVLVVLSLAAWSGCTCAQLPDAVFQCEDDGTCAQPGYVCGSDGLCRRPVDAGPPDAGPGDAGFDAGMGDAGLQDAGFDGGAGDAGVDAGVDAGLDGGLDGGLDAGCTPTGLIDEPDLRGVDDDCDGFDGDLARGVFVDELAGLDTNPGTRTAPVRTLTAALALRRAQVYLSSGAFLGDVTLPRAVSVFGGFDRATWLRTSTKSLVEGALLAAPEDGGRVVLDRLEVRAPGATSPGAASIAVHLRNASSDSRLVDCILVAGAGAPGADGDPGEAVASGLDGTAGAAGVEGGDGGPGGAAVDCGDAGFTLAGFEGGSSLTSGLGMDGFGADAGGLGGLPATCDGGACGGLDGTGGLDGLDGPMTMARPADPPEARGTLTATGWQAPLLETWAPAPAGRPGGGGGAGGGLLDLGGTLLSVGGGAGGGGSGGCGARSGTAGRSGGASIALALFNASPALLRVELVTSAGGSGGTGGPAGTPGLGGLGGFSAMGQIILDGAAGSGGAGGRGGAGGAGRQGPGGWGGAVFGLACAGSSNPSFGSGVSWTPSSPGAGGMGDPAGVPGWAPLLPNPQLPPICEPL